MGLFSSKSEDKTIDTNGNVNNNVVVEESVNIYSFEIIALLTIICIIKIIELACYLYVRHEKKIKRKYAGQIPQ